jgi:AcrR family transcriptional regulator
MNGLVLWLYDIPTFWLGVLFVGVFLAFSLGGLWMTRSWMRRQGDSHNDLANYYIAAVGVFYALLIGLISVATWENYTDVESTVAHEAVTLADLYRDFEGYPPEVRAELRQRLRNYVRHVIEEEWPYQRRGVQPPEHNRAMMELAHRLASFEPATAGQEVVHGEIFRQFNEFLTYRRLRLQAVGSGLPGLMWFVVLIGAAVTMSITFFLWTDNLRIHSLLTASLALIVGLMVFLIFSLDKPLIGRVSVGPDSFEEVLRVVMEEK